MTTPSAPAWYIVFDGSGNYRECGFSPDGTIPEGGKACSQAQHDASGQWTKLISGVIVAGAQTIPLPDQAHAALAAGVAITCTSTPALNATYPCDPTTQLKLAAVSQYISTNGRFPAGVTSMPWADSTGAIHLFPSTAQFQEFATAIADYVAQLDFVIIGHADALPAAPGPIS